MDDYNFKEDYINQEEEKIEEPVYQQLKEETSYENVENSNNGE